MELIHGGLAKYTSINGIKVGVASSDELPGTVEVMVFEEDTNLVLTVEKELKYQDKHPIHLMTDIMNTKGHKPGSLVINKNSWYAVVIDVDADTMCKAAWISEAYREMFACLEKKEVRSAGMHLLGSTYGGIPINQAAAFFLKELSSSKVSCLRNIWLIVQHREIKNVQRELNRNSTR